MQIFCTNLFPSQNVHADTNNLQKEINLAPNYLLKITNIYSSVLELSINIHNIKLTVVALELKRFPTEVPGEVFLTCQQLLQEQDAGGLEEVWPSQGIQTLLNHLQDLAHTQSLGFVQGQGL